MKTIGHFIILKEENEELKTEFGFSLGADGSKDIRYRKAKILAVGSKVDPVLKVGLNCMFDKSSGHSMIIKDETVRVVMEGNIVQVDDEVSSEIPSDKTLTEKFLDSESSVSTMAEWMAINKSSGDFREDGNMESQQEYFGATIKSRKNENQKSKS